MDNVQANFTTEQERLLSLIEYAHQSALLKSNPVKDVLSHKMFHRFEHELQGMPGVHFNVGEEDEEIWLVVERLRESQSPPATDKHLALWLDLSNKPEKEPCLKPAIELNKLTENQVIDLKSNIKKTEQLVLLSEFEQREYIEQQFENYLEYLWKPWQIEEKKRRRTIKLYSELFTLKQELEGSISDVQIELLWGMGIGLWKTSEFDINYPLIAQIVDINLNEKDMSIEIKPIQTEPYYELEVYTAIDNPGVGDLEKALRDFKEKQTQAFSPFDRLSYETLLQIAVTHLNSNGLYWANQATADDRQLPKADENLKITDTWILFARPRSKNLFIKDLENFKSKISNDAELKIPNVIKAVLTEPSSEHESLELPQFRGISSFNNMDSSNLKPIDLFFPMPFNEEQVGIVQKLECVDGVVVQGPPGTGKTHTIANIISHYMANGKRVLVTSMKEPALTVLKEKLPDSIQPLAIALLSSEKEGMKQFEFAVSKIAQELQIINRHTLSRDIEETEHDIDQLHGRLAYIDRAIDEWAKKNIEPFIFDKQQIYPKAAAEEIGQGAEYYEWLDDVITVDEKHTPKFDNADIIRLREARAKLGINLSYLNAKLPEILIFPEAREIVNIHQDLSKYNKLKISFEQKNIPPLADSTADIFMQVADTLKMLSDLDTIRKQIKHSNKSWVDNVNQNLKKAELSPLIVLFEKLAHEIDLVFAEQTKFLANPVYLPENFKLTEEMLQAITNKVQGKSAFGLSGLLGKGCLKKQIDEIRIVSYSPKTLDDWHHVHNFILLKCRSRNLFLRWNSIAIEMSFPPFLDETTENFIKLAMDELKIYQAIKKSQILEASIVKNGHVVCPGWAYHQEMIENPERLQEFHFILESHLNYRSLSNSWSRKENFQNLLINCNGRISELLRKFINEKIGDFSVAELELQSGWSSLIEELRFIHGLKSYLTDITEICNRIRESGGIKWAEKLLKEPLQGTVDDLLPNNWQQAWRLRRLVNYFNSINNYEEFKKLIIQRIEIERQLAKTYQDIVAKRTWLKLADNATPDIKAALQAFRAAITKIGKGTGKRAIRYRRDARNAASHVTKAIPCWIMPHHRVSESLPAEFGCFDLVVIDEASQSDISALPAILRANKLLIVGDDKQVSPEGVGLEEEKINHLMARYLSTQVELYRHQMSSERSIYDLFKVVFADSQIMLREHFRCVSPIIEYSKREFYHHELKPIRLPKKSERLDPPLIDVIIEDGFRKNKENLPEARFIVDEIKKILADPKMKNITIGVVSLLGNEQSHKVWEMLEREVGPELLSTHNITCGDAKTFQGKEKNIMFLSMIVTKENCKADSKEASNQRFNVAASRAQDRMYLVRSIELDDLSQSDKLRRNLIQHFSSPYAQDEIRVSNLRDLCESDFEREIYDILTERGYKITPQVKIGEYRIDMVAEGNQDTRLAIECDGDRYHGADRWETDMNRQRILERVGWQFWRCFASTFVLSRENVISDLISTLTNRGIEPIGMEGISSNIHSEQRRLKALS